MAKTKEKACQLPYFYAIIYIKREGKGGNHERDVKIKWTKPKESTWQQAPKHDII